MKLHRYLFVICFLLANLAVSSPMCNALFISNSNSKMAVDVSEDSIIDRPHFKDFLNEYDRQALEIQKKLSLTKSQFNHEILDWFSALTLSNRLPTVVELTTLQLIVKTRSFNNINESTLKAMSYYLSTHWSKMTGNVRTVEEILDEVLPESVLQKEPYQVRRFHLMSHQIESKTLKIGSSSKTISILKKVLPVSLLAFAFSKLGGDAISGALVGYMVSLGSEYWNHRWLMHSGNSKERLPWFVHNPVYTMPHTLMMAQFHYTHHQEYTPKKYAPGEGAGDLNSKYVKEEVIPRLIQNGLDQDGIEYYVKTTKNNINYKYRETIITTLTVTPLAAILGALSTNDPIVGGVMASLFSYSALLHINITHPMMHETYTKSMNKFGSLKKWFLNSSYFQFIARHHYGHHVKPNTNFHALPLGYDKLLNTEYQLTNKDLIKMLENDYPF